MDDMLREILDQQPEEWDILHVEPVDDLLPHTHGECMCDPVVEVYGARLIIIHNSYDGREERE